MNKDLTIVFSSYQSKKALDLILKKLNRKFKIIIVENSNNKLIKKKFEKKFKNVKVIFPKKNLGLAKSYNLAIKKSKTQYVFLNNPDIEINNKSISSLLICAKKIKNLGAISPSYRNQRVYKNYEIFKKKKIIDKKYGLFKVDLIDNNFLINKKIIKHVLFDENFFLYWETFDFSFNLKKNGKELFVSEKLKFHHYGSSSVPEEYKDFVKKVRSFHFNWGKFYFYKKNYNYFFALKKILPNFIRSIKKMLISIIKIDKKNFQFSFLEFLGIICSLFLIKSFYRPNK